MEWTRAITEDGQTAELTSIRAKVDVRELYDAAAEPGQ